jgi:two-component system CheB/CheR fusion protein
MRVLVVEDDADLRNTLVDELTAAGHEARACDNVPAARSVLASFDPDLVLLDIGLPVFDGNELAAHLRGIYCSRPLVVAVTGQPASAVRQELFDLVLAKPIGWQSIARILDEVHGCF